MNNQELESIWADGIPAKINPEDLMKPEDILKLCIRFTLEKILTSKGYKIVGIIDQLDKFPHITAEKDGSKYGIVVLPEIFPRFGSVVDDFRIKFVNASKEHNIIPVLCPVLIHSVDKARAEKSVMLKGDVFNCLNIGQIILNNEPKQEITPQTLTFKL